LGVGDSFAAIIGIFLGKNKIFASSKTVEGTISFALSSIACIPFIHMILDKHHHEENNCK
jgi:dolichol kinase